MSSTAFAHTTDTTITMAELKLAGTKISQSASKLFILTFRTSRPQRPGPSAITAWMERLDPHAGSAQDLLPQAPHHEVLTSDSNRLHHVKL